MNKDLMKMSILSFAIVMGMTGCDEDKPQKKALINNTPIATVTLNPEDTLVGTVIATKTYPNSVGAYGAKRLSHSLFFIDTDGDTKTAEYIGAIYYPDDNYIQGAGQAFNAERTSMKKTIAQWRWTLDYFQKIQKEKE
jgi:hypothetical protein